VNISQFLRTFKRGHITNLSLYFVKGSRPLRWEMAQTLPQHVIEELKMQNLRLADLRPKTGFELGASPLSSHALLVYCYSSLV
jgi:hypothetical protein